MNKRQIGIIDVGSNSVRLVINQIEHGRFYKELHNFKTVARLSAYVDSSGYLSDKGMDVLLDTLNRFKDLLAAYPVDKVNIVATAAIRNAENQEIISRIGQEIGFDVRILTDYEEAYYGYFAVINSTNILNGFTIDIGGGSTEVTLFENRELKHHHSFPFGAITLQNQFIHHDQPTEEELANLKAFLSEQFHSLPWLQNQDNYPLIGIGGSARNLSIIHQRKTEYPLAGIHQYELPYHELIQLNQELQYSSYEDRLSIDGLSKDRADIIVPAAEVITSLASHLDVTTFIMSLKGLRDGIFYEELLHSLDLPYFQDVAEESFYEISHHYGVNTIHVQQISKLATSIYQKILPYCQIEHDQEEALRLLEQSAKVLYIGEDINPEASSQNTFYLLTNLSIEGITHQDRLALAFISSFKSRSRLNQYAQSFSTLLTKKQLKIYELLGAIMKLAYSLDITRRQVISEIGQVQDIHGQLTIPLYSDHDTHFEEARVNRKKKHLEKALKKSITFTFENFHLQSLT